MLEDRLQDYLMYCKHQEQSAEAATEFISGPISVSNTQDPDYSVVRRCGRGKDKGLPLVVRGIARRAMAAVEAGVLGDGRGLWPGRALGERGAPCDPLQLR